MSLATDYRHARKDYEHLIHKLSQSRAELESEERSGFDYALIEILRFGHERGWIPGGLEDWMENEGFIYWQIDLYKKHLGIANENH